MQTEFFEEESTIVWRELKKDLKETSKFGDEVLLRLKGIVMED